MTLLQPLTPVELDELRTHMMSAAIKLYNPGSELTARQAALPELNTMSLVLEWQTIGARRDKIIAAAEDQVELLQDIVCEFRRHADELEAI